MQYFVPTLLFFPSLFIVCTTPAPIADNNKIHTKVAVFLPALNGNYIAEANLSQEEYYYRHSRNSLKKRKSSSSFIHVTVNFMQIYLLFLFLKQLSQISLTESHKLPLLYIRIL